MIFATKDDYFIKAGELQPGERLDITGVRYGEITVKDAQAALDKQYGKERGLLAYWHGRLAVYRERAR